MTEKKKKTSENYFKQNYKILIISAIVIILIGTFAFSANQGLLGFSIKNITKDTANQSVFVEENITVPTNTAINISSSDLENSTDINQTNSTEPPAGNSGGNSGENNNNENENPEPSCTNDPGCSLAGNFCSANMPYNCTLGADGCFDRTNKTECSGELTCNNGNCITAISVNSCQELNESQTTYLLNTSINQTENSDCIIINATGITLDCDNNPLFSTQSVTGIFSNQDDTTIKNCNVSMGVATEGYGIEITNAANAAIQNNILNSQYAGVYFNNVTNSTIQNNTINYNPSRGIWILASSNNTIQNNNISAGLQYGVMLHMSNNTIIQNNTINSNIWYGILIEASASVPNGYNTIQNNQIQFSRYNMYVKTSFNTIKENLINASTFSHGLYIYNATNNTITDNTITNNVLSGLRLRHASNNTITDNTIKNNNQYGLEFSGNSYGNTITNNNICTNTLDITCSINQLFGLTNYCSLGSVCGGTCIPCL